MLDADHVKSGDPVKYRAFAGDVYDAVVTSVGPDGFVSIDVIVPGCKDGLSLRAVRVERVVPKESK